MYIYVYIYICTHIHTYIDTYICVYMHGFIIFPVGVNLGSHVLRLIGWLKGFRIWYVSGGGGGGGGEQKPMARYGQF